MYFLSKATLVALLLATSYPSFSMDESLLSPKARQSTNKSHKIDMTTYLSMFKKIEQPDIYGRMWIINTRSKILDKIFSSLNITLSQSQIVDIFNKYQVLMHRPLTHDKLVIGCGNLPPYNPKISVYYIDNYDGHENGETYRAEHAHSDSDTIDPDFTRDPTIVGETGKIDPNLFQGKKYKSIVIEGILILPDEQANLGQEGDVLKEALQAAQTIYQILDEGGTLTTTNNIIMDRQELKDYITFWTTRIQESVNQSSNLSSSSSSSNKNVALSHSVEEFMEKYNVTLEEIFEDLKVIDEEDFWIEANFGWENMEAFELSQDFKDRVYGRQRANGSTIDESSGLDDNLVAFMKVYNVSLEEILQDLKRPKEELLNEIELYGWENIEAFELSNKFKDRVYGK